ncbi:hypothetical protein [Flavobacterium sp. 83]|uniref:hypothetical protein n=1 Tax=Flavobacterium sp. 83 TaxID=1131812 RepID=UPI000B142781|nr:hypothetical protein [Flavobacterium sp. 83]
MKKTYILIIIIFTLFVQNSYCQTNELYNEMFKWKISIPTIFENVNIVESEQFKDSGKKMFENSTGQKIVNKSIKIYSLKNEKYNRFIANYQPTDSKKNYSETFKSVYELMNDALKKQMPTAEIEFSISSEMIDKIKFETCNMKITYPNKMIVNLISYSTIIKDKILNVQITYENEEKGQLLLNAFKKSKFDK